MTQLKAGWKILLGKILPSLNLLIWAGKQNLVCNVICQNDILLEIYFKGTLYKPVLEIRPLFSSTPSTKRPGSLLKGLATLVILFPFSLPS